MTWFRGDCHVHSLLSDGGDLTPAQLVVAARAAGLDFLAVTEHNTTPAYAEWATEHLLVIHGQEVTTRNGHWLALGLEPGQVIDWRYGRRDDVIDRHRDRVHRSGGLCVAAHPYAPYPSGRLEYPVTGFDAVEIWNGPWHGDRPWNADNEAALADWGRDLERGRWRPAIGNSDTHLAGQIGLPHTVVRAPELTPAAILAGLRSGHSWLAGSAAVELTLEVSAAGRTAGAGDRLRTGGEPAAVRLTLDGVREGTVTFHTDRGTAHRESLPGTGSTTIEWSTRAPFVRVEVRHPDGAMAALTNPVFLQP